MWELDCEESWVPKNWCFWTVELEKTPESPLDCKEIQPVHPKGDQSWVFIGRTDAEGEPPILWPPHVKSWLIGKDPDAGRDWGQVEKGMTEDEMPGWHHQFDAQEFGWTLGVGDGQEGLACCDSWGLQRVRRDWATKLNWTEYAQSLKKMIQMNLFTKHWLREWTYGFQWGSVGGRDRLAEKKYSSNHYFLLIFHFHFPLLKVVLKSPAVISLLSISAFRLLIFAQSLILPFS